MQIEKKGDPICTTNNIAGERACAETSAEILLSAESLCGCHFISTFTELPILFYVVHSTIVIAKELINRKFQTQIEKKGHPN